jgi:hypothetical protein
MLGLLFRPPAGSYRSPVQTNRQPRTAWGWFLGLALALPLVGGCKNPPCSSCGPGGTCTTSGEKGSCSAWVAGCHCPQYEPGSIPAPNGTYTREAFKRQAEKAEADDFVFYNYEFNEEGSALGPAGCRHLIQVAHRVKENPPFPVLIEATGDPKIDLTRRQLIVGRLGMAGVVDADQRVLVGLSQAEGLYGEEAPRIYGQLLRGGYGAQGGFGFANQGGFGGYGGNIGGYGGGPFGGPFGGGVGFVGGFGAYGR